MLGNVLLSWYPYLITKNIWWSTQCPATTWTSSNITAATQAVAGNSGPSSDTNTNTLITPVNSVWNLASCSAAAPIANWTWEAYLMIGGNFLGFTIWVLNILFDNQGKLMHMIFLRTT